MIRPVISELAAIIYYSIGGAVYALFYRFFRLVSRGAKPLVKHVFDLISGLLSGLVFIAITDLFYLGEVTVFSVAVFIAATFLFVFLFRHYDIPSSVFIDSLLHRISKICDFSKLKMKLRKPIFTFTAKLKPKRKRDCIDK